MELDVHAVLLTQALQDVAGDPDLVRRGLRAFAEDLEFPLALRHLGVDALVIDSGRNTEVEMLLDDLPGDVADVLKADAGVVRPLGSRETLFRKAERLAVLHQEVFLLEAEPRVRIIDDACA